MADADAGPHSWPQACGRNVTRAPFVWSRSRSQGAV